MHIASVIVRSRCETAPFVAERLTNRAGVEVHAVQDGKIIVVLEAETERDLAERMEQIRQEADVLLVNLVYHQVETA